VREVKVFANQNAVGRGSGKVWAKYIKAGVIWAGVQVDPYVPTAKSGS
jgi:hypothetical protein